MSLPKYSKNPFTNNVEEEENVASECTAIMVLYCTMTETTAQTRHIGEQVWLKNGYYVKLKLQDVDLAVKQ